jgi:hypothetical protein
MPVETDTQESPLIYPPADETVITRYLDLTKFLSLISTSTLFLSRLDLMEDQYEGRITQGSIDKLRRWYDYAEKEGIIKHNTKTLEEIAEKNISDLIGFVEYWRKMVLINCWTKFESESYALWKIFAKTDTGVIVKSSVRKLKDALKAEPKKLYLSEIKYYKKEEGVEHIGNLTQYVIHKNIAYQYENEIRLFYNLDADISIHPVKFDWGTQENQGGVSVKVDLDILIDAIILAPDCPRWFEDIIHSVCGMYNINKPVSISELRYKNQ